MRTVQYKVPTQQKSYNLNIDQFLGLNLTASIKDNEAELCDMKHSTRVSSFISGLMGIFQELENSQRFNTERTP